MKNIKKLVTVMFALCGFVALTACDMARFAPEDCRVNASYQIECDAFDPPLTAND
jgi:hypothetical protein